jgi:hypothetical protein
LQWTKNLTPWRDSNPGSSGLVEDTMICIQFDFRCSCNITTSVCT